MRRCYVSGIFLPVVVRTLDHSPAPLQASLQTPHFRSATASAALYSTIPSGLVNRTSNTTTIQSDRRLVRLTTAQLHRAHIVKWSATYVYFVIRSRRDAALRRGRPVRQPAGCRINYCALWWSCRRSCPFCLQREPDISIRWHNLYLQMFNPSSVHDSTLD